MTAWLWLNNGFSAFTQGVMGYGGGGEYRTLMWYTGGLGIHVGAADSKITIDATQSAALNYYGFVVSGTHIYDWYNLTFSTPTARTLSTLTNELYVGSSGSGWSNVSISSGTTTNSTIGEIRLYSDAKSNDWLKAEYALVYNDTGIWQQAVNITPSILNSTNGTYFTVSTDLYGWIRNTLDGLSNVSYTWWNGSTAYSSGTAINVTGDSTGISHNIANISSSLLNADDVWILQVNGTNGTTNVSDTNSSSITITNTAPTFTNVSFTANGSSYQLGPVQLNFSATDLDTNNITYFVNWFKNGTNISSFAQTGTMLSGTTVNIAQPASVFNVSDNWYARVWVTDGTRTTPYNNTHNTTIQAYFTNVSVFSPPAAGGIYTSGYLNLTLGGASNVTARAVLGSTNVSMVNSGSGSSYVFNTSTLIPTRTASLYATNVTFYYSALLANGSTFNSSTNYAINVSPSGFYLCNATFTTVTANYTFYDASSQAPLSGALNAQWQWMTDAGENISQGIVNTSTLTQVCITPSWFNRTASIYESVTVTGYIPYAATREAQNYSSTAVAVNISFVNSTTGAVYTFRTLNQFGGPISGATIQVYKAGAFISSGTTDTAGNFLVSLEQLQIYQITATATDYVSTSFVFIAGGTTSTDITLLPSAQTNASIPDFQNVFGEVQYVVAPQNRFFTNATNLSFTVFSNNSSLQSWGMYITFNGSTVYSTTQTAASGGTVLYLASQPGIYYMNIWFKAQDYQNFTPSSYAFVFGNSTGLVAAGEDLQDESFIDGFTFYLIIIFLAMMATLWVSKYNAESAAPIGLLVLWGGTFLMPNATLVDFGGGVAVTLWMASALSTIVAGSAWYLRQPGT